MHTRQKRWRLRALIFAVLAAGAGTAAWAAGGSKLVMNGNIASTSVRVMNGKAYVPLTDVAAALNMTVVPIDGGYEIKTAGGANPIKGLQGKVGDVLFDGKWRFQVLEVKKVDSYTSKFDPTADYAIYNPVAELNDKTFAPKNGRELIAIKCRVTNGRNKGTHALWVANSDTRTAIADLDGESFPPIAYDMDTSEPFNSKQLVPGAKTDFTVLFAVPEDTKLKDLIYTLRTIDNNDKGNDARVSLGNN